MKRFLPLLIAILAVLPACSVPTVINALVPGDGYRVVHDIPYGDGPRRALDLYVPEGADGTTPMLVFFYGGGWESGEKESYLFAGQAFASRGYVTAIPDYRVYPDVIFPDFLRDGAAAVAWATRHATDYGAQPGPVYLVGHSAGAHIAAMLTLDGQWLGEAGLSPCGAVRATAGLAGPYDFLPLKRPVLMEIFGPEATRPQSQPINFVSGSEPPMLLITGRSDTTVLPRNTENLAARIMERGGEVETLYYDGIGHIPLVGSLASPLRGLAPALNDVDDFLRRHRNSDRDQGSC
jgi:acetyl esterase/lipase